MAYWQSSKAEKILALEFGGLNKKEPGLIM